MKAKALRNLACLTVLGAALTAALPGEPVRSAHYEITPEAGAESAARDLSWELEQRFGLYSSLFHFDPALLTAPLQVRVFTDQAAYDAYVTAKVGQTRAGAVYLHYNLTSRRELVVCRGSADEATMLPHQAFVQYLRGFIANPPSWMREGFAIYFNSLSFDAASGQLVFEENLAWLAQVKAIFSQEPGAASPGNILEADYPGASSPENFQIRSWALVSFLLNGRFFLSVQAQEYFRTLAEGFMILSPTASAEENSRAVAVHLSRWIDLDALGRDWQTYLTTRKTFEELIQEGRDAYAAGDAITAERSFLAARELKPSHYFPYYYLGILYYDEKSYDLAAQYYQSSLERGAGEGMIAYALGINAAAAGKTADAIAWLNRAAAVEPDRYKAQAEEVIARIQ